MAAWLDYQSAYFDKLNLTSDQSEVIQTLTDAAIEFVEKYCNRSFQLQEYDRVYTVTQDGSIILDNPPISFISRLAVATGGWLRIQNTSGSVTNASYATTADSLKLTHYASGVRENNSLSYATYPTLTALATAINDLGDGWTATVSSGRDNYPSVDIITQQYGNAKTGNLLSIWDDYSGYYDQTMRLPAYEGYWQELAPDSGVLRAYFVPGTKVRAVYTAGFADVPEPIKQAVANLVVIAYQGAGARIQSESIGAYSYELATVSSLPINDAKVLAYYKDRRI